MTGKAEAYAFLKTLHKTLNKHAPPPDVIKAQVAAIWSKPDNEKTERERVESKENIPFYNLAAPQIFQLGKTVADLTDDEMKIALRCVYYGKYPELSSSNVRRKHGHPFSKKWGLPADKIIESWRKPQASSTFANEAWPEAGLSEPFPFRIVFEAKYFDGESANSADSQFVNAVYETVFYRGLPTSDGWEYDFGCLVAYDVSTGAYFKAAWDSVASKHLFWDHANVFIMIVRATHAH